MRLHVKKRDVLFVHFEHGHQHPEDQNAVRMTLWAMVRFAKSGICLGWGCEGEVFNHAMRIEWWGSLCGCAI